MKRKLVIVVCLAVSLCNWFLASFDARIVADNNGQPPYSVLVGEHLSPEGTYNVRVYQQRAALTSDCIWCEYVTNGGVPVMFYDDDYSGYTLSWKSDDVVIINGLEVKLPFSRIRGDVRLQIKNRRYGAVDDQDDVAYE